MRNYSSQLYYLQLIPCNTCGRWEFLPWASCQIRNIANCACAGNAGSVFIRHRFQRKPLVSDPGMHHGTCVMHVPWCMSGSLNHDGGVNRSRHSRSMRNSQFDVSGKRPIASGRFIGITWLITYFHIPLPWASVHCGYFNINLCISWIWASLWFLCIWGHKSNEIRLAQTTLTISVVYIRSCMLGSDLT